MGDYTKQEVDRLKEDIVLLKDALSDALAWIDAVPKDTDLPTMPGFDRDMIDELLSTK